MPHVSIKLVPGKSEEQKTRLAEVVVQGLMTVLGSEEDAVSVAIIEIAPEEWTEKVYQPDIQASWEKLYKKPGYDPLKK
jgi:4-oxalocrotonate tautomerase